MAYLKVNHDKITPETADKLINLCPFGAITKNGSTIDIGAGCKMCGICSKKGPEGAIEMIKDQPKTVVDKNAWCGIAVYAELSGRTGKVHPVAFELLGKAKQLAVEIGHPVYAVIIGYRLEEAVLELLTHGADKVFVYDAPELEHFKIDIYTNAFCDFINKTKPSSVLVGATNLGRSLAPRVAASVGTGLTADCTSLEIKENTDLVQIRPAFGGNIMARIITPNHRPQFCTVRYKIFDALPEREPVGERKVIKMTLPADKLVSKIEVIETRHKPAEFDISEAELIVACGRGVKNAEELETAKRFADSIGAQLACTRPMVEAGWFDPRKQIGLSGRTVKPKLIITLGISGSVQFAAGMKNSDKIIAVNIDPNASIFKIAHIGMIGDWKEIISRPMEVLK